MWVTRSTKLAYPAFMNKRVNVSPIKALTTLEPSHFIILSVYTRNRV